MSTEQHENRRLTWDAKARTRYTHHGHRDPAAVKANRDYIAAYRLRKRAEREAVRSCA
jgi:hypothetical protein